MRQARMTENVVAANTVDIPDFAGKHVWLAVVGHLVNDPTVFDDDCQSTIEFGAETFVGVDGPFCHYCRASYPAPIMGHCLGKPPKT